MNPLIALLAVAAQIFTVTSPSGVVHGATEAELDYWTEIGTRTGVPERQSRDIAFTLLVDYAWIRSEAAERGIVVTREKARQVVDAAFPSGRAFRRFRRESGLTLRALRFTVRHELMSEQIRKQVIAPAQASVTEEMVDAHLAEHGPLMTPELRDLRLIWTATRRQAVVAKRELAAGAAWRSVARRYALGPPRVPDVVREELEPELAGPVFRAKPRRLRGPVKGLSGFYVFRVTRIHPPRELPPEAARRTARRELVAQAQQAALEQFLRDYDRKWAERTTCARAYESQLRCGVGRDPAARSAAARIIAGLGR